MEISGDEAIAACEQVRAKNKRRYWSGAQWQCGGCMRFGGEPEKRCMRSADGWDACPHLNKVISARG